LHERLELSTQLPQSLLGLEELRSVLIRFLGVYRPLDKLLLTHAISGKANIPAYVARADFILHDLIELRASKQQLARIPEVKLPTALSPFQELGMRYVVEGSAMGGRIIRKHIESSEWGGAAVSSMQFFSIDEKQTGCAWKDFKAAIDAVDSSPAQCEDAISGATLLFKSLIASFSTVQHESRMSSHNE